MSIRTFWEGLLAGALILGTLGTVSVMVRQWMRPTLPDGVASMDVGRAPESNAGDSATRWMDHWDNVFERQADGTIHHKAWRVSVHGREAVGTSTSLRSLRPDGVLSMSVGEVPDVSPADIMTRWMDHEGMIWERDEHGQPKFLPARNVHSDTTLSLTREIARIQGATGFLSFGVTSPQCPITIRADAGREACLDWRSGIVTVSGDLPVAESARLFVEALSTVAPWPPACAP